MKKGLITITILISFNPAILGVLIQMPDGETLEKRLIHAGFGQFLQKTNIVDTLKDKTLKTTTIAVNIETAIMTYSTYTRRGWIDLFPFSEDNHRTLLYEVILQDSPEGLQELKKNGILF